MMYISICPFCVHFEPGSEDGPPSCAAFPAGIPDMIARSGYDHRNPYEGDGGILFEPDGPVDVARLDRIVSMPAKMDPRER